MQNKPKIYESPDKGRTVYERDAGDYTSRRLVEDIHNDTVSPTTKLIEKIDQMTSIEWLLSEMKRRVDIIQSEPMTMAREIMIDNLMIDLEQAKEMHKRELDNATLEGYGNGYTEALYDSENK